MSSSLSFEMSNSHLHFNTLKENSAFSGTNHLQPARRIR